jgi:hypothetical protein
VPYSLLTHGPSHVRRALRVAGGVLLSLTLVAMPAAPPVAGTTTGLNGIKVAVIVGPAGSRTSTNRTWGDAAAAEAAKYTSNVVKVYSPNATWRSVKAAMAGASVVVYIGLGYGYPGSGTSSLSTTRQDGMALNTYSGASDRRWSYYGERYMRTASLAPNAVVILSRLAYASGNSPYGQPSASVAQSRADNYAAGFLAAGAAVVIADYAHGPAVYVRDIFTTDQSMFAVWQSVAWYHHRIAFASHRVSGAKGMLDPTRPRAFYYRSIVGSLATSTVIVRGDTPVSEPPAPATATVPASINASCGSTVSSALNAWIASQPDGSTLIFPPGSCYRLGDDAGINLVGRSYITLVGTGSTLQLRTTGVSNASSAFLIQNSSHITVRGFAVDGDNPATGTVSGWSYRNEHINGAAIRAASSHIEFDSVSWDNLRGFGVFVSADGGSTWPADVSVHDSSIRGAECGLCVVAGRDISFARNTVNDSMGSFVDLEPDASQSGGGGFSNVSIIDNSVTRYGWVQSGTAWMLGSVPSNAVVGTATMNGLTVSGNRIYEGAATSNNGNFDGLGGLGIRADKANIKNDFVITDNWTATLNTGPSCVMYFANVHNLTVTGNTQPIANGADLVCDAGTTGARTVSGNTTTP